MKNLILILTITFSQLSYAVIFEISDVCENKPVIREDIQVLESTTVGHLSKYALDIYSIPYLGSELGLHSILNTPHGKDAIQYLEPNVLRVYGWCYEINGIMPGRAVHDYLISPHSGAHIRWFYGYAERKGSRWIEYCKPAYEVRDGFICLEN